MQKDIEAVVDATRRDAQERLSGKDLVRARRRSRRDAPAHPRRLPPQEISRESRTRREAEAVLAETTKARSSSNCPVAQLNLAPGALAVQGAAGDNAG